ncbi:MAG: clostripain-related cysteine peptidase [Bacteroidaceae bacterium]|nr:clostripain-related cysteine peptidase [Bacteroidaceae bacterium]
MNKLVNILLISLCLLSMSSCGSHGRRHDDGPRKRTILVYMAGDNNLTSYVSSNINSMMYGLTKSISRNNDLVAYVDRPGQTPVLLHITESGKDTLMVFPNDYSAHSVTLTQAIDKTIELFPAESYGLVMWSHGTGWVPSATHLYIDSYKLLMQERKAPMTRAFGLDMEPDVEWMDLDAMVEGIPAGVFDFILFDACYMSSIEVLYELRGKANWFIGSEIEILVLGFPYAEIMEDLFHSDYLSVCQKYYGYYDIQSGEARTAGVALVDASKLDNLASAFRAVTESATVDAADLWQYDLQYVDRFRHKILFDLKDLAVNLEPSAEALEQFEKALDECVVFRKNTPYSVGVIKLETYSGLNAFVPLAEYEGHINGYFYQTGWNQAVNLLKYGE